MSLRYGLLGFLAERPASGYDITRRFEAMSVLRPVSHPQIYTELNKLAKDKLIEVNEMGPRGRKVYKITPHGLEAVKNWLKSEPIDHALRIESVYRSAFLWLMEPQDQQKYLESEQAFFTAQAQLYRDHAATKDKHSQKHDPVTKSLRITVEAGARVYTALAEWALWARNQTNK